MMKIFVFSIISFFSFSCYFSQINSGEWYVIFNSNNLKVELSFDVSSVPCNSSYPSTYKYRYNGYLGDFNEYVNWKIDYNDCNNDSFTYGNGVSVGGAIIKNELGTGKLEDAIKEEFDDQILIKTFKSEVYDISNSKNKRFLNKKIANNINYKFYSEEDYIYDENKDLFLFKNETNKVFTGKVISSASEGENISTFLNGKLIEILGFFDNGKKRYKAEIFNNDFKDRMEYGWFDNGQLGKKARYVNGNVVDIRCWDEDANEYTRNQCLDAYVDKEDNEIINVSSNGTVTIENGNELVIFKLCDNQNISLDLEKEYKCFSEKGGLYDFKGGCEGGSLICGNFRVFLGNKLIVDNNYEDGLKEGIQLSQDENGKLESKSIYKNGTVIYMKFLGDSKEYYKEFDGPFLAEGSFIREYDVYDNLTYEQN